MKYIFVILFIIVFFRYDISIGYSKGSPIYTHLTYMFQHTNAIHLILNSFAFIGIFRTLERFIDKWVLFLSIISIGIVVSFFAEYTLPTVGASSMIYSMIGLFFGFCTKRRIRIIDKKKLLLFIVSIFLMLTISFFKTNSNFILHLYSICMGFCISFFLK